MSRAWKLRLITNRFWLWKALETLTLGLYFVVRKDLFEPPYHSILNSLDDTTSSVSLMVVGLFTLAYVLFDIDSKLYKSIMTGLVTFVWLFFLISFIIRDATIGIYISIQSIYAFYVLGSTLLEVVVGRR